MANMQEMLRRRCFGSLYATQDDGSETIVNTFIEDNGKAALELETPYGDLIEVTLDANILVSLRNQLNTLIEVLEAK